MYISAEYKSEKILVSQHGQVTKKNQQQFYIISTHAYQYFLSVQSFLHFILSFIAHHIVDQRKRSYGHSII